LKQQIVLPSKKKQNYYHLVVPLQKKNIIHDHNPEGRSIIVMRFQTERNTLITMTVLTKETKVPERRKHHHQSPERREAYS